MTNWLLSAEARAKLFEEYIEKECSVYQIAETLKTYPMKIQRALKYHGIVLRTKSEATKGTCKHGRHPKFGKKFAKPKASRTWQEKVADIQKLKEEYEGMPHLERVYLRSLNAKSAWKKNGEDRIIAHVFNEFFLENQLPRLISKDRIVVTESKLAVVIKGPAYYHPYTGWQNLLAGKRKSRQKIEKYLSQGYIVVAIKCIMACVFDGQVHDLYQNTIRPLLLNPGESRLVEVEMKYNGY